MLLTDNTVWPLAQSDHYPLPITAISSSHSIRVTQTTSLDCGQEHNCGMEDCGVDWELRDGSSCSTPMQYIFLLILRCIYQHPYGPQEFKVLWPIEFQAGFSVVQQACKKGGGCLGLAN
jgi:hypothetical protein